MLLWLYMASCEDVVKDFNKKLQKLDYVKLDNYRKDIQQILDHFGVGKLSEVCSLYCIKIVSDVIPLGVVKTTQGVYLFIEMPTLMRYNYALLKTIDKALGLKEHIFAYSTKNDTQTAHIGNSHFAVRKILGFFDLKSSMGCLIGLVPKP